MADDRPVGVVVMAYGTPASRQEILPYYTHIRRGTPPPAELLDELSARYDAIGGLSPLAERTRAQCTAIAAALDTRAPGRFVVSLGQRHAAPFIEDGVAELAQRGVQHVVGLVLAPHYSRGSVGQYHQRAGAAIAEHGLGYTPIEHWHLLPAYLEFLASAVRDAQSRAPTRHKILFTAHSLPERVLDSDPYPEELRESAARVAGRLGLNPWADWTICWQSAGRTGDAWRGPDVNQVIRDLADTGRVDGVVVCPQGFVADGLEVLYDIDVQARTTAEDGGLELVRTRSLNADPAVMAALAELVDMTAGSR